MINGIVNVYKEKGYTSFDVVAKMRGIYHQKKIGHTGTLDPDAEGVLPVCLGKATKVCDLLTDKDKEYEAVLLLGQDTDTQDVSGQVLATTDVMCSEEEVQKVIMSFVGTYDQLPPMYSALKVNGQKLYDLARKGITVERKKRPVTIHSIEILGIELPRVRMKVHCSKGTYIRTLCKDIGDTLGCYGCMESLLRTRVATYRLEDAIKLSELEENPIAYVRPIDEVFLHYEAAIVLEAARKYIDNGNHIPFSMVSLSKGKKADADGTETLRFYDEKGIFIGLYYYVDDANDYKPLKIFMEKE